MLGKKSVEQINAKISSIIGTDMVIEGNITAKEAVRVEGTVNGNVETEGALIISSSGSVKGDVKGSSIIIGGLWKVTCAAAAGRKCPPPAR